MGFEKLKARWRRERRQRRGQAQARRDALRSKAVPVFERFGIEKAFLFGSVAKGASRTDSDIDLLVTPLEQESYWDFRRALQVALDYELDLYTQADDPVLVNKIKERDELLYDAKARVT
ncbi:MAG: nucleotidyltransferase domain-containing protein [Trueperaceae bacterium]